MKINQIIAAAAALAISGAVFADSHDAKCGKGSCGKKESAKNGCSKGEAKAPDAKCGKGEAKCSKKEAKCGKGSCSKKEAK